MDDEHIYEVIDDDSPGPGQLMPHHQLSGGHLQDYRVSPVNRERNGGGGMKSHLSSKSESSSKAGRKLPGREKKKQPKQKPGKETTSDGGGDAQVGKTKSTSKTIAAGLRKGLYFSTTLKGNMYSSKATKKPQGKPDSPQRPQGSGKEIKDTAMESPRLRGEGPPCDNADSGDDSPPPPLPSREYLLDSSFTTELKTIATEKQATEKQAIDSEEDASQLEEDIDYTPMDRSNRYEGFVTELEGIRRSSADGNTTLPEEEEDDYVSPSIPERHFTFPNECFPTRQHDKELITDSIAQSLDKGPVSIPRRSYDKNPVSIPSHGKDPVSIPSHGKDPVSIPSYGKDPVSIPSHGKDPVSIPRRSHDKDPVSIPRRSNLISIPGRSCNNDLVSIPRGSYEAEPIASEEATYDNVMPPEQNVPLIPDDAATYDNVTFQEQKVSVPAIPERSYEDTATYDNVAFQEQNTPVPAIPDRSYKDEATYDNVTFQEKAAAVPVIPERSYKANVMMTAEQHIPMVPTRSYKAAPANVTTPDQHLPAPPQGRHKVNYDNVVLPERSVPVVPRSCYKAGASYSHNDSKLRHYDNSSQPTTAYSNTETETAEQDKNDVPHIPERNYEVESTSVGPCETETLPEQDVTNVPRIPERNYEGESTNVGNTATTFPGQDDENYVPLIPNRNYAAPDDNTATSSEQDVAAPDDYTATSLQQGVAAPDDNTATLLSEQDLPLVPERCYENFASELNKVVSAVATKERGESHIPPIPERHYVIDHEEGEGEEEEEAYMNQQDAPVNRDAPVIPTRTVKRSGGNSGSGSRDETGGVGESDEYDYVQTGARYTLGRHARARKEGWGHRK